MKITRHDVTVERPATWFKPGGPRGPSKVTERAGYVLRERGDTDGEVATEYCCPIHGRFTVMQPRSSVADDVPCMRTNRCLCLEEGEARGQTCPVHDLGLLDGRCAEFAPWSPSSVGVGVSSGEVRG